MDRITERRKFKREKCQVPLTYQSTVFGKILNGEGVDYSDDGLSFESQTEINPGAIILIKHLNCDNCSNTNEAARGCRTATFATVKWSHTGKKDGAQVILTGAQYLVSEDNSIY